MALVHTPQIKPDILDVRRPSDIDPDFAWFWDMHRFSALMGEGGGLPRQLGQPAAAPTGGGNMSWAVGSHGLLTRWGSSEGNELQYANQEPWASDGIAQATIISVWAKAWGSNDAVYGIWSAAPTSDRLLGLYCSSTTNRLRQFHYDSGGAFQENTVVDAVYYDGTPTFTACIHDATNGKMRMVLAKAGGSDFLVTADNSFTLRTTSNSVFHVGEFGDGASAWNGDIYYVAWLDGVPSESQLRKIATDVFGPFRMAPRRVGFVAAAPAAGVISPYYYLRRRRVA